MNLQEMAEKHGRGGGGREFRRKVLTLRGLLHNVFCFILFYFVILYFVVNS